MYERLRVYVRVRKGVYVYIQIKTVWNHIWFSPQAFITTLFSYHENKCSDRFLKLTKYK